MLLLHYRVSKELLRPLVPASLEIEEHGGSAWVSVVPFRMLRVRARGLPAVGFVSDFAELNVRTYVRHGTQAGVFFLRIQAAARMAAFLARKLSPLPYAYAPMAWRSHGAGVSFESPELAVDFAATGPRLLDPAGSADDSLDSFLTERYCMYADSKTGVQRADVHHVRWPMLAHRLRITRNRLLSSLGVPRPLYPDRTHFSLGVEVLGWSSEKLRHDEKVV